MLLIVIAGACRKKETLTSPSQTNPQATPYSVRMTDLPGPYTAVNVDIQSVIITGSNGDVTLSTNAGIYNLLNYSNGSDTLIAQGNLNSTTGTVQQIRLVLGPNCSVVSGGTTYPLTVPSGEESGLKLQVHHTLQAGIAYQVLLDFDANQSIVAQGNGGFHLKPVIRTVEAALGGSNKGHVTPIGVPVSITATSSTGQSYSTIVSISGYFLLSGLPAGSYSVLINPVSPYNTQTVNNVNVTVGTVTDMGGISL